MHHEEATGRPSVNLDGWMLEKEQNLRSFHRAMAGADIAVVEGVMGLFDGHNGRSEVGSTAQMAKWLGAPVLLVLDCWALSRSAAAMIKGYEGLPLIKAFFTHGHTTPFTTTTLLSSTEKWGDFDTSF
jgi:cobyrinic acid a,c-diamide synthase